jgi:hypothetical protein
LFLSSDISRKRSWCAGLRTRTCCPNRDRLRAALCQDGAREDAVEPVVTQIRANPRHEYADVQAHIADGRMSGFAADMLTRCMSSQPRVVLFLPANLAWKSGGVGHLAVARVPVRADCGSLSGSVGNVGCNCPRESLASGGERRSHLLRVRVPFLATKLFFRTASTFLRLGVPFLATKLFFRTSTL